MMDVFPCGMMLPGCQTAANSDQVTEMNRPSDSDGRNAHRKADSAAPGKLDAVSWLYPPFVLGADVILGKAGNQADAIDQCREMFWLDAVGVSSRLLAILQLHGHHDADTQVRLCNYIFGGDARDKIEQMLRIRDAGVMPVLFNEWQLMMSVKLALLHGGNDPRATLGPKIGISRIGRWYLTVGDLVEMASESVPLKPGGETTDSRIAHTPFFRGDPLTNLLGRYYDLLMILPGQGDLADSPNRVNIQLQFERITGLDLEMFMALGHGVYTKYAGAESLGYQEYLLDGPVWFAETIVSPETSQRALDLLSMSRRRFAFLHEQKYGASSLGKYFDVTPFRQRPLIEVEEKRYVPVGIRVDQARMP
jgi:hypothetical protein